MNHDKQKRELCVFAEINYRKLGIITDHAEGPVTQN